MKRNIESGIDGKPVKYQREGFTFFKPYYKTLRLNKIWGRWWNKGSDVVALITARCNLHCDLCPTLQLAETKQHPKYQECTLEEWKKLFDSWPEWISQVYISGGEPSIIPWVSELINHLVKKGHHVTLLTNLFNPENLMGIKKHWRFVCIPTFHFTDDPTRYVMAYNQLRGRFRMIPQELGDSPQFAFSRKKEFFTKDWLLQYTKLHIPPDGPRTKRIFLGCDMVKGKDVNG